MSLSFDGGDGDRPTPSARETRQGARGPALERAVEPPAQRFDRWPHRLVLRNLAHDVGVVLRLFLPLPHQAGKLPFSGDPRVIGLGLVFVLALAMLADYAEAAGRGSRPPLFNIWGVHVLVTRLAAEAAALFLVALAVKRPGRLVPLLCGLLAVELVAAAGVPLLASAHHLAGQVFAAAGVPLPASAHHLAGQVFAAACAVVVGRIAWRELEVENRQRAIAALAAGAAVWGVVVGLPSIGTFRSPPDWSRAPPLDIERTYMRQSELVDNALAAVRSSTPDVEETYFVGFASYAAQNVFENEVRHIDALFRERFGTEGRSALLVNSRATVRELPLANSHNLAAVLRGFAAKMGAEDTLFLHMTSHGSRNHKFSVDFSNLPLRDLSADAIGAIVAEAELPWRVIVVAACFSGGYIDALKSPRALVMTASRADRESFGCEHGREYTYFGEALYRDSVTDGDFVAAFHKARGIVEARERREDREPSEPQIWIGEAMARKLAHQMEDAS